MNQPNDQQLAYKAHKKIQDALENALWMAGYIADERTGEMVNYPLTDAEIKNNAESGRPYSWAFKLIIKSKEASIECLARSKEVIKTGASIDSIKDLLLEAGK